MPASESGSERPAEVDPLAATLARVRVDREHGASWLAREAALALAAAAASALQQNAGPDADFVQAAAWLRAGARNLARARPSMAALATTVAHICAAGWPPHRAASAAHEDPAATRAALARVQAAAEQMAAAWDTSVHAIAAHARPLLRGVVFTHSRSGTVEQALTELTGVPSELRGVIVTQSHPGDEGVATARALASAGLPVTLVADAAVGLMVGEAKCVALGADSVRADGSVVNKVGSYPLALAAHAAGVPVYALCETLKVAPEGWPLALEEMDPKELLPKPVAGVAVRNVYFDLTPAFAITAFVTEQGVLRPEEVRPLAQKAAQELEALQET
jgi:translation initiation factor eIF-2B subunit delta